METAKSPAPAALRITRTFPAPPEEVFRAWTDPQALVRWFGPDRTVRHAHSRARPARRRLYRIERAVLSVRP
jgi:Uncharacterized conserved protein